MKPPDRPSVPRVQGPRASGADLYAAQAADPAAAAGREVDEPRQHRRRPGDRRGGAEAPAGVARASVERDKVAVPGADEDRLPPDGGRSVDVGTDLPCPEQVTAAGPERVDRAVGVTDEDAPVADRRRRVEVLAAAEPGERAGVPALPPRARIDAVHGAAARGDEDRVLPVRRRRDDLVVRGEGPADQRATLAAQTQRIELVVPGAEIERAADDERRRLHRAGVEAPVLVPGSRVPRDHEAARSARMLLARQRVHVGLVHDALADRRRGSRAPGKVPRPDDLPGARVERVEPALLLGHVDLAVGDRGRKLDVGTRLQLPEAVVGRAQRGPRGSEVRALDVVAVGRPSLLVPRSRVRLLLLRLDRLAQHRRELLRRGAANRARPLLVPGPGAERRPRTQREQRNDQERPAQDSDPGPQKAPGDRQDRTCAEQDFRGVGDYAFERSGERQDPEEVSGATCRRRR